MFGKTPCLLFFAGLLLLTKVNGNGEPKIGPEPITNSTVTPTTPTTPTTSIAPTTTVAPKPTTVVPTTSTLAPTTSTTVTPTTTVVPPTPAPTPVPNPEAGIWSWTDKSTNQTCVVVEMALQLNASYTKMDNQTTYGLVNIPVNTTRVLTGDCGNTTQYITLEWAAPKGQNNSLMIQFDKDDKHFMMYELFFTIAGSSFTDAKEPMMKFYHVGNMFSTPVSRSYHCAKEQHMNLTAGTDSNTTVATVVVSKLQIQAFRVESGEKFSSAADCEFIDSPDIVPIAVGCALAALVIIVLIAYLVGRRRSQARGYLSM